VRMSGYVQGLVEISNADGHPIFRGHYYDSRTVQALTGDDALTPTGQTLVDHFENGFGEGAYAGHAFSLGVQLIREGDGPLRGEGRGRSTNLPSRAVPCSGALANNRMNLTALRAARYPARWAAVSPGHKMSASRRAARRSE
jgi:hypothetical protein